MGNMIIAIQTFDGIAIAVESPHLAKPEETPNIVSLNPYTVMGYHETMSLGQQMVDNVFEHQSDLEGDVFSIAEQTTRCLDQLVSQEKVQQAIGFLFLGYAPDGRGAMLGWFHAGDRTNKAQFFPYCTSRPCSVVGYLIKQLYTPDIPLAGALELAAYTMTQSKIVLAKTPVMERERFNLAAIYPDKGFSWLSRENTESIVRKNQERDRVLRIQCTRLFVDET